MNSLLRCKPLLGTFVEISLSAETDNATLVSLGDLAFAEIEKIHNLMSFHEASSELTRINNTAYAEPCDISDDTATVIRTALDISTRTNGIFDITIADTLIAHGALPGENTPNPKPRAGSWRDIHLAENQIRFSAPITIDLGGIAKGYAVDKAIIALTKAGASQPLKLQAIVNAGGDLRMLNWQGENIDIRIPNAKTRNQFVNAPMQAPALATSAPGYAGLNGLIIEPVSREMIHRKISISLFAPTCMIADALTKVAFLDPNDHAILDEFGASALIIDANGNIR